MGHSVRTQWIQAIALPLFIFLACYLITFSQVFQVKKELLSTAIVIDLLITAPLVYFLSIRKSSVSKWTVIRVLFAGILFAGWILRAESNSLLSFIKIWVSPCIEALVIFMTGRKFYLANKSAHQAGVEKPDFLLHCRAVMQQVTGNEKAGNILSSEIAVLYYAFFGRKDKNVDYVSRFSSYKENGILLVLGSVLSLCIIETTGVHFLLTLWNHKAAWILTILSLYTCLQLYAHMVAVRARPITLGTHSLDINNGLGGDAVIKYENIIKAALSTKAPGGAAFIKIALINGLENHNCVVYLKQPITVSKVFGVKKTTDTVLFFVDRPKDFMRALDEKLVSVPV